MTARRPPMPEPPPRRRRRSTRKPWRIRGPIAPVTVSHVSERMPAPGARDDQLHVVGE
jgi:hypothetical protein